MVARFEAVDGLDELVAGMVAPEVRKVARKVERRARRTAPGAKRWVSMADGRVRSTHKPGGGAHDHYAIPENLRYKIPGMDWDRKEGITAPDGYDYFLEPRDLTTGHTMNTAQNENCRCHNALLPTAIAEKIRAEPMRVYGTEISVTVSCTFVQIVACEFGDSYPTRAGEIFTPGTHFMGKSAAYVAATM